MSTRWEPAFVAVSALLGEPVETIRAALGDDGVARAGSLVVELQSSSRATRVQGLARGLVEVARDLDRLRLP
jgi:hypothetical protein